MNLICQKSLGSLYPKVDRAFCDAMDDLQKAMNGNQPLGKKHNYIHICVKINNTEYNAG